jgi:predicted glycoside hydrolase/deacetylase ChbG (UPF0249 family)
MALAPQAQCSSLFAQNALRIDRLTHVHRLILNADDFGLTLGVNRAIAELYDAGALSSATLMASGKAFDDAVAIAQQRPRLGVGCHIVLVDSTPVSPPAEIPSLLGADGINFRSSLIHFLFDLYRGRIRLTEIEVEAAAQIKKLQRAGIKPTHIDTHKHTHMFPRIASALIAAAGRCGITAIRNPFEEGWSLKLSEAPWVRLFQVLYLHRLRKDFLKDGQGMRTTDGTIGIAVTGTLTAAALRRMFETMPPGTWELVCHPGYNDADLDRIRTRLRASRETELRALLSEIPQLIKKLPDVEIINYGKIYSERHS